MERHLAAILAADVAGYSRLVNASEEETLERFQILRRELIEPLIAGHNGRVVKVMGDGFLVEFASAVEAVACAIEWQKRVAENQAKESRERRFAFRIGINLGDIIADGEDIHGDGVNIAARLEGLAQPGGILISGAVHHSISSKLPVTFEDDGEQKLKNVAQPVQVFRMAAAPLPAPVIPLTLPDKPSIAVLPFANLSANPEHDHFADGLTHDIITGLSRNSQIFVIAHSSTRTYKGISADLREVGEELGVRYILEGSVRRSGQRVRITGQLIDAQSRAHLWAEKYDRPLADFFELQDEITRNVVSSIATQLQLSEARIASRLPARDLTTWALVKRAWGHISEASPASLLEARQLTEQAIAIDPGCAAAYWTQSDAVLHAALMDGASNLRPAAERARSLASEAIARDDMDENGHWAYGIACLNLRDHDTAIAAFRRALEINPNCSIALGLLGAGLIYTGFADEGIGYSETALRSNPRDPSNFFRLADIATGHFVAGRYDSAIEWAEQVIRRKPDYFEGYVIAAASAALSDDVERAREIAEECRKRIPDISIARMMVAYIFRSDDDLDRLRAGLDAAGFPR